MDFAGGDADTYGALPDGSACSYDRPFDVCFKVKKNTLCKQVIIIQAILIFVLRIRLF